MYTAAGHCRGNRNERVQDTSGHMQEVWNPCYHWHAIPMAVLSHSEIPVIATADDPCCSFSGDRMFHVPYGSSLVMVFRVQMSCSNMALGFSIASLE